LKIEENELNLERERETLEIGDAVGLIWLSGHGNEMKLKNENGLSADDVTTPSSFIFVSFLFIQHSFFIYFLIFLVKFFYYYFMLLLFYLF